MNLFADKHNTISQAGMPRHNNCMRLPVSWVTINNWEQMKQLLHNLIIRFLHRYEITVTQYFNSKLTHRSRNIIINYM